MKQVALLLLVFACGFGVCWLYRDSKAEARPHSSPEVPYYLQDRIKLQKISKERDGVRDEVYSLHPYAINTGGGVKEFEASSGKAQRWSLSLDGGRVTVFCEERDEPIH